MPAPFSIEVPTALEYFATLVADDTSLSLTEAAVAWRREDRGIARLLALRAEALWRATGRRWPERLALALAAAGGLELSEEEARSLIQDAVDCPLPGLAVQVLSLGSRTGGPSARRSGLLAREMLRRMPESARGRRLEVLAPDEIPVMEPAEGTSQGGQG